MCLPISHPGSQGLREAAAAAEGDGKKKEKAVEEPSSYTGGSMPKALSHRVRRLIVSGSIPRCLLFCRHIVKALQLANKSVLPVLAKLDLVVNSIP